MQSNTTKTTTKPKPVVSAPQKPAAQPVQQQQKVAAQPIQQQKVGIQAVQGQKIEGPPLKAQPLQRGSVQATPKKVVTKDTKVVPKRNSVVVQPTTKAGTKSPTKPKEEQKQQAPQPEPVKEPHYTRKIKLPALLQAIEEDKAQDKCSFFLDETGKAFQYFKYKGEVIDISKFLVQETLEKFDRKDCVEKARQILVQALKMGGTLVFYLDLMSSNLQDYFKGVQFFADPESLFTYSKLLKEEFHKKQILTPEEDVDFSGHKGAFMANHKDFEICLLCNIVGQVDPVDMLKKLGLDGIKHCFSPSLIIE